MPTSALLHALVGLIAAPLALGCGSSSEPSALAGAPENEADVQDAPAVMVAVEVRSPGDDQKLYVGAFAELPGEELDLSNMIEAGSASSARSAFGYVYLWNGEAAEYTRWRVDDSLGLVPGPRVSFANFGVTGPALTHFAAPDRAYTMLSDAQAMVVWDPESMQVLGSIPTEGLFDPEYPRVEYGEPVAFGDYVAWPILWSDYDQLRFKPEVAVALVPTEVDAEPIIVRDARCGAGWSLFKDPEGDVYAVGNGYFGFAHFFGEDPGAYPNDCVLRLRAGTTEFDANYTRDLNQITGSPAVYHTWSVEERTLYAAVWDPAADPAELESEDAYWEAPLLRTLVRLDDDAATVVPGLPKSAVWSTLDYRLDGTLYLLESEGSLEEDARSQARSSLYRVSAAGVEKAFSTSGEVAAIGRIR